MAASPPPQDPPAPSPAPSLFDLLQRAATSHQQGRLEEAEALYGAVLAAHPQNPDANHNLGVLAMQRGQGVGLALPRFRAAWESDPSNAQRGLSYLRALVLAGDLDEARRVREDGMRRGFAWPPLAALQPSAATPAARPGAPGPAQVPPLQEQSALAAAFAQRDFRRLDDLARALIERYPGFGPAHKARAAVLLHAGRTPEAMACLREAAALMPGDPEIHATLGTLFLDGGLPGEAEPAFRRAIRIEPRAPAALVGAGRALLAMNRFDEAEAEFRAAAGLREDSPALCGLARALAAQDRAGEAESAYERVLARDPGDREAYAGLGSLLVAGERVAQAEALCRRVLAHDPARVDALYDLGTLLTRQGRLEEAEASYRGVLARRPDHLESRSCLLFLLHYAARRPPADLLEESRAFGAFASARAGRPFSGWTCDPRPARLRVGLVSGDLRNHPVGFFLEGLVATADPARIEWVAYPTYPESDELTARLHARIGTWRPLAGLADEEAARLIRDDGIHVLVDLAGHTVHNRLPVFAWRPAPVQVTWLGYFATTGMREMDWILADRVTLPPGLQAHFTERVRYLPDTRLCFTPPAGAPAPRPLPALANGFVTFGCFQAQPKITGEVLQAWARILAQVPGSRLRLQNESLSGAEGREALARRLAGAGIDVSRVGMHGFAPRAQYLDDCGKADFLLDTFPYPGGTTTCEALWMGVPTLTLAGESMIARQGAGLAAAAGLPGWVAQSVDDYVSRAVSLAGDVPGLASLRSTLRDRVARSPLFDAERFSRAFAQALWELWAASPAARAGGSASG